MSKWFPADRLATAASLVAAAFLSCLWTSQSWFINDDFFNAYTARVSTLNWDYLSKGIYQHFAPGHRLVDWVLWNAASFDWTLALGFLYAALILSGAVLVAILDRLCGRRWWHVLVGCWFVVSFVWVRSIQWWANGLHTVPGTLGTLAAVYCAIRAFENARSWRWPILGALALAFGLAFYEKPVLAVVYLPLLRLAVFTPVLTPRHVLRAILRDWRVWTLFGVVAASWYLYWTAEDYAGERVNPTSGLLQEYGRLLWLRGFVPALIGVRVQADASTGEDIAIVAGQIMLGAFVIWTVWRRPIVWRAWAFFAIAFWLNALLLGLNRIVQFGSVIALDARYSTEYLPLFAIAAALAVSSEWPRDPDRGPLSVTSRRVPSRRTLAAVAAVSGVVLVLNALSSNGITDDWPARNAERFYDGVRASVAEYEKRTSRPPAILDDTVIEEVIPSFLAPFNRMSYVLPTLRVDAEYNTPTSDLRGIAADGSLVPLRFVPVITRPGRRSCASGPASLEWRPPKPVTAPNTELRLTGSASANARVPVFVDETGQGFAPYDSGAVPVRAGRFSSALVTTRQMVHGLRLALPPKVRVCVRSVELGDWRARGA